MYIPLKKELVKPSQIENKRKKPTLGTRTWVTS